MIRWQRCDGSDGAEDYYMYKPIHVGQHVGYGCIDLGGLFDRRADFIRIATNAGTVFESIERWGSGAALQEVRYSVGQRKLLHGPGVGILIPYGKTL